MTRSETIKTKYNELLQLAKELDSCFKTTGGTWGTRDLMAEKKDAYWETRKTLESDIAKWMGNIRKAINTIPAKARKFVRQQRTHFETQETYFVIIYDNLDYEALLQFFRNIQETVEGRRGVLANIKTSGIIYDRLRSVRGDVLALCESLELFIPEIMVTIEQQVDLIFSLRDNGMSDVASLIEEIDQTEDNYKKCANARTALEKMIQSYCEHKDIEVKRGFHTNLDNAIDAGLAAKKRRNAIGGHYSFLSRVIHKEIQADSRNTQFAVNGALNILTDLLKSFR